VNTIENWATLAEVLGCFGGIILITYAIFKFCLKYSSLLTPVRIDGTLYVLIAIFGASMTLLQSDEVYKYLDPYFIFYCKSLSSLGLAGTTALKMFRSRQYGDHVDKLERENKGNTDTNKNNS
jgi:hypothetical protein